MPAAFRSVGRGAGCGPVESIVDYCSEEEAEKIIAAGDVDVEGSREGFLTGLPVGEKIAV